MCAFGILAALVERQRSGKGQIVDCSMTEGAAYVGSFLTRSQKLPIWGGRRGENILDGGAFFYGNYETSDGKFMSVGALEPQFYDEFVKVLGLSDLEQTEALSPDARHKVQHIFKTKTQQEWSHIFEALDACVFPVLDWQDADQHPQNVARKTFAPKHSTDNDVVANPAPKLSRTPGVSSVLNALPAYDEQVAQILAEVGLEESDIRKLYDDGAVIPASTNSKL